MPKQSASKQPVYILLLQSLFGIQKEGTQRYAGRRRSREEGSRDWSFGAIAEERQEPKEHGRLKEGFFPRAFKGAWPQ